MITVPDAVRRQAENAGAHQWLDDLPALIAGLERDWTITVGRPFGGATEAYVAEASTINDEPAVLKLIVPVTATRQPMRSPCCALPAARAACACCGTTSTGALLLERLGRSLYEIELPIRRRHQILCDVAARVWRPAPECGLPTGADKGRWLTEFVTTTWEALSRPCSERTVDDALACADRRIASHNDERARLVHGDVHQWNTLESADGFALVDPDGLLAAPEYDLGIIMREDPVELLRDGPHERAQWLAERTGLDAAAIWEWGVIERLATGLRATSIGLQPVGDQMLDAAEAIAAQGAHPF